jgi:hypothetical protein
MKVNQDYEGTSLGVADAAVTVTVADADRITFDVTGTFTGTITFEASVDGTTFVAYGGQAPAGGTVITTLTAPGVFQSTANSCQGFEKVRARMSAYTSGTALVKYQTARVSK